MRENTTPSIEPIPSSSTPHLRGEADLHSTRTLSVPLHESPYQPSLSSQSFDCSIHTWLGQITGAGTTTQTSFEHNLKPQLHYQPRSPSPVLTQPGAPLTVPLTAPLTRRALKRYLTSTMSSNQSSPVPVGPIPSF